jgi:hypothetical protein
MKSRVLDVLAVLAIMGAVILVPIAVALVWPAILLAALLWSVWLLIVRRMT